MPLLGIESLFLRPTGSLVTMLNTTISVNRSGKMNTSHIICEPFTEFSQLVNPFGRIAVIFTVGIFTNKEKP